MMTGAWRDIRLAVRLLAKDRAFTLSAVAILALGIAATTTVFTLLNGVLFRALPFAEPERVVQLSTVSIPDFADWRRGATRAFADLAVVDERAMTLAESDRPAERWRGGVVSANTFALLGEIPILGRDFRPEDDEPGAPRVVILGHDVWRTRYQEDRAIVGQTIRVDGIPAVVIGVTAPGFEFPLNAKLWLPLGALATTERTDRTLRIYDAVGRLRPGVTLGQAREEVSAVAARLARDYPDDTRMLNPSVERFRSGIGPPHVVMFAAMLGAVGFVLLIACANVANLLLARASARAREVSVRLALGASRARIVRQLLLESVVLAGIAGTLGLILAVAAVKAIWRVLSRVPDPPPFWLAVTFEWRVFAFLAAICLGSAVLFGLMPALHTARTDVLAILNEATSRSAGSRRASRWSGGLVVMQLALAIILLTGAGLMMRNLARQVWMDAGVRTDTLVRMGVELTSSEYQTPSRRALFFREFDAGLASLPGIDAALATAMPMNPGAQATLLFDDGRATPADAPQRATLLTVGPRYLETIGATLLAGRTLAIGDGEPGTEVALVNQRFVDLFFGGSDALGRRIKTGPDAAWLTIVGVAANVYQRGTETGATDPVVYIPLAADTPARMVVLARADGGVPQALAAVRAVLNRQHPDLPIFDARTVDEHLALQRWGQRIFGSWFVVFAAIALLLAAVGLYAVTAYTVSLRTREIGVRIALGAATRQVWWLITRRASLQLLAGVAIGTTGALAVSRVLPSFLAGTQPAGATTVAGVSALLVAVGLAACVAPARRAARLDPAAALRTD